MRRVDVTGGEIEYQKSVENKAFPGAGTVWTTVLAPRFFMFNQSVEIGLL